MADSSIGSSLANILGYIWGLILAFFAGQTTSARSELPPTRRTEGQQTLRNEKGQEQFLRHPSLCSSKGRQKHTNTETPNKRFSIFSSGASMQCLNSFVHRLQVRPTAVPVVIVTPSTPTRDTFLVAELPLPSSSSPLELADPTVEPSHHVPTSDTQSGDTGEVALAPEKQLSVPPDIENDISDVTFDSWTLQATQGSVEEDVAEPYFFLPESLQKITVEPIRCASHALSAVSDMLYDVPAWSGVGVGIPSYFTSTPPRRCRSAGTKLRDIENNYVEAIAPLDSPNHDALYQSVDLIPYPDVFDLDMYYDATIPLRKKLKKLYNRDCTFKDLSFDTSMDLPIREKLSSDDKYGMPISSVTSISSPVAYHEPERDFKACCDNISQSPSTPSLLKNTSSPTPPCLSSDLSQSQHNPSNPHPIIPLDESTTTSFRTSTTTSPMPSPTSTLYSIEKSTTTHVKSQREPILAPAHSEKSRWNHYPPQSRTSLCTEQESDAGSMDALKARLREACDGFSTTSITFTKEIEIWEPVSF